VGRRTPIVDDRQINKQDEEGCKLVMDLVVRCYNSNKNPSGIVRVDRKIAKVRKENRNIPRLVFKRDTKNRLSLVPVIMTWFTYNMPLD